MLDPMLFLNRLFGSHISPSWLEIRGKTPSWAPPTPFFREYVDSIDSVFCSLAKVEAEWEVPIDWYIGVLPRKERKGTKDSVRESRVVWVDVDSKHVGGKHEAYNRLTQRHLFPFPPSLLVDSGNGYHGYWLLSQPISDIGTIEGINAGLASVFGGDRVFDASRVLRIPGTTNWKDRFNPVPCELISSVPGLYSINCFEEVLKDGLAYLDSRISPAINLDFDCVSVSAIDQLNGQLSDHWRRLIKDGLEADIENSYQGDRSRLDLAVCIKLLSLGLSDEEVIGVLLNPSYRISSKTLEKPNKRARESYLTLTLQKAKAIKERS